MTSWPSVVFGLLFLLFVGYGSAQEFRDCRGSCCDTHRFCRFWASRQECANNPAWMLPNCRLSCGNCDPSPNPPVTPRPTPPFVPPPRVTTPTPIERPRDFPRTDPRPEGCPAVVPFEVPTRNVPSSKEVKARTDARGCAEVIQANNCGQNRCFHLKYRSIDGTCNNMQRSLRGAAFTPFTRLLSSDYDDGVGIIVSGQRRRRPNPREVSHFLLSSVNAVNSHTNSLLMQFGQFLSHDITKNSVRNFCDCRSGDLMCANIPIPNIDEKRRSGKTCIHFTRSVPVCGTGINGVPREQFNENTAYIDASMIYGSEPPMQRELRLGAFLRTSVIGGRIFPPNNGRDELTTGDDRSTLFIGLAALHTSFVRFHNSIAADLQSINPSWNTDRIYQEARKIVGSSIQVITYQEFLPALLGPFTQRLLPAYKNYNPEINPGIMAEFAAASYRLHGMIQEFYPLLDSQFRQVGSVRFLDGMFQLGRILNSGLDQLYRGLISMPSRSPQRITTSVTEMMFNGEFDMASINIQRGRDVGLRSYNDYRRICNLQPITSFDSWPEVTDEAVRRRVAELYSNPDEVDLYLGGIVEEPVRGSLVGPTFACIIAEQFTRLRDGDRFYYENPDIFTPEQVRELKKITLSWVLCVTGDRLQRITPKSFVVDDGTNAVPCEQLPTMNLNAWRE